MLKHKILSKSFGILTYGITPPKSNNTEEKLWEITNRHLARIRQLEEHAIDGLIVYDIQDESDRTEDERPYEFIRTVDPSLYSQNYLKSLKVPRIVYRCVGNYDEENFSKWLTTGIDEVSVFVGTASADQIVKLKLPEAYALRQKVNENIVLGGVTIPERHLKLNDEPERIGFKYIEGCRFFVSQAVYNVEASKKFLEDYYHYCQKHKIEMVPILFTLTPCGSEKTLNFIKWLGINVPQWLEDELLHSGQRMLEKSVEVSKHIFKELTEYALEKGIPIGANIESVSVRKEEIEASIELTKEIAAYIQKVKASRL